jgi:hypothetical protein
MTTDLQTFLTNHQEVATHSEITDALNGISSLHEAQKQIHSLFWKHHQNFDLLRIYGEFLYLSGYDTHPDHNRDSLMICVSNQTTRTVKRLALEQWQARFPQAYPGYVWLHYPNEQEQRQGKRQVWQVSVYHQYENALTHAISIRLGIYDGYSWDQSRSRWYREHAPYAINYSTSMIAEYLDGRLQVIDNITYDWDKKDLSMRHCSVLPHVPAFISEHMFPGNRGRVSTVTPPPAQDYEEVVAYAKPEDIPLFGAQVTSPIKQVHFDGTSWRGIIRAGQRHYSVTWVEWQWRID